MSATNKVAIVTGTTGGLGHAVAEQLLGRGWTVIGVARRAAPFRQPAYHHVSFDLARIVDDANTLATAIGVHLQSAGRTRIGLVNNAASPEGLMPLAHLDPALLARVYAVNLIAPVWLMGFLMRERAPNAVRRIVNVSSGAATNGFPGLAAYGGAKAALRLAGMSLAREWDDPAAGAGAAILSYEPGVVDTDMQRYARSRPPDEFPWVGIFLDFAARGIAVPPARPASDIVDFLESDNPPAFAEARLRS